MLGLLDHWRTRTHGALDATAEVITRVWKGAEKQGRVPPRDELAAAVSSEQRTHWKLDAPTRPPRT